MTQRNPVSPPLRFRIALALPLGRGTAFMGWTDDAAPVLNTLNLLFDDGGAARLPLDEHGAAMLIRTPRPLPDNNARPGEVSQEGAGFVVWVPASALKGMNPMLTLNDQYADVERVPAATSASVLSHAGLLAAFGTALHSLAGELGDKGLRGQLAQRLERMREDKAANLGRIEQAWRLAGWLLLIGRLECEPERIAAARLQAGPGRGKAMDCSEALHAFAHPAKHKAGAHVLQRELASHFCLLLPPTRLTRAPELQLELDVQGFAGFTFAVRPHDCRLADLDGILKPYPAVAEAVVQALRGQLNEASAQAQLQDVARECFRARWKAAPAAGRYANVCAAGITAAWALADAGVLMLGYVARPAGAPMRAWLHTPDAAPAEVSERLVFLPAERGMEQLRKVLPHAGPDLFFVLHVPTPTTGGAPRALRIALPHVPEFFLKIETGELQEQGTALARAMLGGLPSSDYLWRNFKLVFDKGLGTALNWAGAQKAARSVETVHVFGTPPRKPRVSVIVPLYGRCDFMRHQLAQFCDDPEFAEVDLIYVVDDPALHTAALNLASRYQPLFDVPLRVLTYAENRGYAGANNCGVKHARAPVLVLLNSDVLPQEPGWLSCLQRALGRLPGCGMVGPLLQFPEGSVQHAGMAAVRQFANPGLVFSHHPGKGCAWEGGNKPVEQPMLTGACLMLRKSDYEAAGGLDEGYIVGDFEDSDFSLKLRSLGRRLYLVPQAKLWHLERQSQYLGDNKQTVRDMLTLYNAWRYRSKIDAGLLPDPERLAVAS